MASTLRTVTLSARAYHSSQSAEYREIVELRSQDRTARLSVEIKRDTYDQQSYARVQKWDGDQWQAVAGLGYATMQTGEIAYKKDVTLADFASDRAALLELAALTIFGVGL